MATIPTRADGLPAYYNSERLTPEGKAARVAAAEREKRTIESRKAGAKRPAAK